MANKPLKKQCKRIKKDGTQCCRWAVMGYDVCQVHGAGSPFKGRPGGVHRKDLVPGPNGVLVSGKYSKLLPLRILYRYEQALNDTERLALNDEIALVDARLGDLLSRVDSGEALEHWYKAREAYIQLVDSSRSQDAEGIAKAMKKLDHHIGAGASDYAAWREVSVLVNERRKLVESERKRLIQLKAMVRIDEAVAYIRSFIEVVRGHVDNETMQRIDGDFLRITARTGDFIFSDPKSPASDTVVDI